MQPHLVIYNLVDKLKSDADAVYSLTLDHDEEVSLIADKSVLLYAIWTKVRLPEESRFHVWPMHATYCGFYAEDDHSSDDVVNWHALRPRTYKLADSPRTREFMRKLRVIYPRDESVSTMDSGNVEPVDWWVRPSRKDQIWAEGIRQWQESSAVADSGYYEPWIDDADDTIHSVSRC